MKTFKEILKLFRGLGIWAIVISAGCILLGLLAKYIWTLTYFGYNLL